MTAVHRERYSNGHTLPNGRPVGDAIHRGGAILPFEARTAERRAPHNLEAEQALLGAILVNNEAMDRVSSFLDPLHFYDPLHQQIYETAGKIIQSGKRVTPITLRTFFENHDPISPTLKVWQYLGTLAAQATTIINAEDYGRTIYDLATRRALIAVCENTVNRAYDGSASSSEQVDGLYREIDRLRSQCSREALSVSRCLADVQAQSIKWFWTNRIALGKLALLAGAPGLGKTQLIIAFAAAGTTGGRLPDGERAPLGSVIIITTEDDAADTIVPRLQAAGADLTKVHLLDWARGKDRDGNEELQHFDVGAHAKPLAELIRKLGDVVLILIDPITAHSGRTDSHVTAEVRRSLVPLQTVAAETGAAVVLISHLNKGGGDGSAMNRVTGSNAYVAVCRSAWLVAPDPKDSDNKRRLLVPMKNNIGDDKTGFAFTIQSHTLPSGIHTSRVAFDDGCVFMSADDLVKSSPGTGDDRAKSALDEACEFLKTELKNSPQSARDIAKAARDVGISSDTLKRARKALGVKARKSHESKGRWQIELLRPGCEPLEEAEEAEGAVEIAGGFDAPLAHGGPHYAAEADH